MLFDIVIPLGPNEVMNIHNQIKYTKKMLKVIEISIL